jgi:AcrR family transcriptional regulator
MPGTLSRERIVDVALQIAEREGPEALSMRRIAAELGTGAMSLYNHVPDKAALLAAVAERVLAEVELPEGASWRETTRVWATSLRAALLAHRAVVMIVISAGEARPLMATSRALVLQLRQIGIDDHWSLRIMGTVGRFVAGSVFLDAALIRRGTRSPEDVGERFAEGLRDLLDGMALRVPGDRPDDETADDETADDQTAGGSPAGNAAPADAADH